MIEVLFGVLLEGLKLWNTPESAKLLKEATKLQKEWLDEYNKPRKQRDNSNLDYIEQQLHLISKQFIAASGKPKV